MKQVGDHWVETWEDMHSDWHEQRDESDLRYGSILRRDPWFKSVAFYLFILSTIIGVVITVALWGLG